MKPQRIVSTYGVVKAASPCWFIIHSGKDSWHESPGDLPVSASRHPNWCHSEQSPNRIRPVPTPRKMKEHRPRRCLHIPHSITLCEESPLVSGALAMCRKAFEAARNRK